ncbi:MAG: TatD family hydrolase [Anaerolineales bacterium]|nr:MAG: TatD family hydrolase [Anaerolineales bacterium]
MALVDTHCHLDLDAFDADRAQVVARAQEAGVDAIVNPSIDMASAAGVVALAQQTACVYAAVGVHPNSSTEWNANNTDELRQLAQQTKVVAIGEIGLDYYWDKAPHDVQKKALQAQLELAAEMELPVIVHNREASEDLLAILLEWQAGLQASGSALAARPGVLHSFSGDQAMAEKAVAAGYFLGFTGPLTFKNAPELQAIAEQTPLERIVVETDSPYLSPHPLRGQRNEPARVTLVAEKLAELKGMVFDEVAAATTANARQLFRIEAQQ